MARRAFQSPSPQSRPSIPGRLNRSDSISSGDPLFSLSASAASSRGSYKLITPVPSPYNRRGQVPIVGQSPSTAPPLAPPQGGEREEKERERDKERETRQKETRQERARDRSRQKEGERHAKDRRIEGQRDRQTERRDGGGGEKGWRGIDWFSSFSLLPLNFQGRGASDFPGKGQLPEAAVVCTGHRAWNQTARVQIPALRPGKHTIPELSCLLGDQLVMLPWKRWEE